MRVKLKSAVCWPPTQITSAGVTLEVSDELANDWIGRGIAEASVPVQPLPPPPPPQQQPKGKR